jgi:hypothetical protein
MLAECNVGLGLLPLHDLHVRHRGAMYPVTLASPAIATGSQLSAHERGTDGASTFVRGTCPSLRSQAFRQSAARREAGGAPAEGGWFDCYFAFLTASPISLAMIAGCDM